MTGETHNKLFYIIYILYYIYIYIYIYYIIILCIITTNYSAPKFANLGFGKRCTGTGTYACFGSTSQHLNLKQTLLAQNSEKLRCEWIVWTQLSNISNRLCHLGGRKNLRGEWIVWTQLSNISNRLCHLGGRKNLRGEWIVWTQLPNISNRLSQWQCH